MDIPIKDEQYLVSRNGYIVNTDTESYLQYVTKRSIQQQKDQEIAELKDEIQQLKVLILQMVNKDGN